MLAIIRKGNGEYYTSLVFGYYQINKKNEYDYDDRYIVLSEEKDDLISLPEHDYRLRRLILIADPEKRDWTIDETGNGCVDYLPFDSLLQLVDFDKVPAGLLAKCIEEDSKIKYSEYQTVKEEADIEKFSLVSGDLHDACIKEFKKGNDSLYVLFDGIWGCRVELWFEGDVSYSIESRDPEKEDPYWFDSTLILNNGYVILVDGGDMTEDKINENYCWFKGRNLTYRIIPT